VRARRLNPKLLVCCSVRRCPRRPRTRDECEKIAAALNEYFDYVLVHGDERITRLEEHFPDVASIKCPSSIRAMWPERPRCPPRPTQPRIPPRATLS